MPKMKVAVAHKLAKPDALERIKKLLSQLKDEHGDKISNLSERWDGDKGVFAFETFGFKISGTLTVSDREAVVEGDLPILAGMFKDRIEQTIRGKAQAVLA